VRVVHTQRVRTILGLALLATACSRSETWGTPEYFERIVGVRFEPSAPVIRCQQETGFDHVGFRIVRMPDPTTAYVRANISLLTSHPRQEPYERQRTLVHWSEGPLEGRAREAFEFALLGAEAAVEESACEGMRSRRVRDLVMRSLVKPTTLYSYQFDAHDGDQVIPEALDFRVLDTQEGVLYELVNFS
jgi:hypothetical protein